VTGDAGFRMPQPTHEEPLPPSSPAASRRGWLISLFAVYLALLTWIVLWKLEPPYIGDGELRHIKLVPFVSTTEDGASEPFEVTANVLLFIPFGLYLGLLAPSLPWWKLAGLVAGASLTLEVIQYVLAVGSSDITDIVVNTAGGVAGLGLLVVARRALQDEAGSVMTRVCSVMTALFLLASGIFIASPLHYAPIRDVDLPVVSAP
jgi:glycopeptide antibiotics resistance protein